MNKWGAYPLEKSPLYRAGNRRKLLKTLRVSQKTIREIAGNKSDFYFLKSEEINGKHREIQLPTGALRRLHERIKVLLERVETRNCVMSPKGGVTIRQNGLPHTSATQVRSFDIRKFYPSTTGNHVFRFFLYKLQMTEDLAGLMTMLITFEDRVPFGSPLSPILCAHLHDDLFGEFERVARHYGLTVTAWVDDVSVSGPGVPPRAVFEMRRAVAAKGLRTHRGIVQRVRRGAKVTGTVVRPGQVRPSNDVQLKIKERLAELNGAADHDVRRRLLNSLIGLHTHCLQVYQPGSVAHSRMVGGSSGCARSGGD
jgi:hypothetical protein